MTIREYLVDRTRKHTDQLVQCDAPEEYIERAKQAQEAGPKVTGLDQFGDLEIIEAKKWKETSEEDPGLFDIILFSCKDINEILMYTRFDMDQPQPFELQFGGGQIFIPAPYRCETVLVRLAVVI